MSGAADPRLRRLLGGIELAQVRQRLRRHFERAEPGTSATSIRLQDLQPDAYRALCQLTGRPTGSARSMLLDLSALDSLLRVAGLADSLRDALERLDGPIIPKARLRRERQAQWSALAESTPGGPLLRAWLVTPGSLSLLKRVARDPERAASLLAGVESVLQRLPARGQPRSQLAAETLGDAHALDAHRPIATLVLAVWRRHEQIQATPGPGTAPEDDTDESVAEERQRDIWARAGVLVSELARPALILNLPTAASGLTSWLPGEPGYLSLRQLVRTPPAWRVAGRRIFICENPDVVAIAADRLGPACAPMICTDGMPAAAQRALLQQLADAGARLHYHGDYDWPGIGIGNHVMRTYQAQPWRFDTYNYLAAIERTPPRARDLDVDATDAIWDSELGVAMSRHGLAIAEEAVIEDLLVDLRNKD